MFTAVIVITIAALIITEALCLARIADKPEPRPGVTS